MVDRRETYPEISLVRLQAGPGSVAGDAALACAGHEDIPVKFPRPVSTVSA